MISTTRRSLFAAVSGAAMAVKPIAARLVNGEDMSASKLVRFSAGDTLYDQVPQPINEREWAWSRLRDIRRELRDAERNGPVVNQRQMLGPRQMHNIEALKSISAGQRARMIEQQWAVDAHNDRLRMLRAEIAEHLKRWSGLA